MANAMLSHFQNLWPFSLLKIDDLRVSNRLVRQLSVPEQTKQFIFAVHEPNSQSVVYILAVQNLSEQSSLDSEYLVKSVQPDAVVVQVATSALPEIQAEINTSQDKVESIPTSSFGVLKRCFIDKINKSEYENVAGNMVLQEIFGTGFYGYFWAAKRAAEEVNSHFLLLESPYENTCILNPKEDAATENLSSSLLKANSLLPSKAGSVSSGLKRFCLTNTVQSQMVKSLTHSLALTMSEPHSSETVFDRKVGDCQPRYNYQAPWFAQTVYSLLADLHDLFTDLPAIGKALAYAQKMLTDVNEGEPVDTRLLSEVHNFRIAVEGLRIGLNNVARCPNGNRNSSNLGFNELPPEEKCHVLFAEALRNQARNFRSVVAIVDAGSLAGLRKHWNTPLPPEVADLANQGFSKYYVSEDEVQLTEGTDRKRLLTDKPMVAVGAGATAVLGASSLSKAIPASTFLKLLAYKVPSTLNFSLAHIQRTVAIGLSKMLGPSKLLASGVMSSGAKVSTLKVTASAEKIRAVAHSVVASGETASFLGMRTSFYEIMRKRRVRPLGFAPWATFSCSMATCAGFLVYGDGIECAAESVPLAPMIASVGRGLRSLHQASQEVRQSDSQKIQEALQSLMNNLKKSKAQ